MSDLYKINPLEWRQIHAADRPDGEWLSAATVFGDLHIRNDEGIWRWSYCVDEYYDRGAFDTISLEAAKAEAEAWYLSRLLPALEQVEPVEPPIESNREPDFVMERHCPKCGIDTPHLHHSTGHERDSSQDWRKCHTCGHRTYGM